MTDVTHDGSEDGFHEIQLSGKQLVFLFMATTVVSVVIFLCGVLVGRSVRIDRPPELTDPAAAVTPAPSDTVAEAATPSSEPPVPADEGEPPLSYKQRLESDKAPAEALEPADAPKPTETPKPETPRAETAKAATPPPAAVREPDPPKSAPAQKTERGPAATSRDGWVVQLVALRDRQTANSIVQRLSGKGYPAFLVSPAPGAPAPVFKVQVGRYADRDQAELIRRRLEKEEQFKPWISR